MSKNDEIVETPEVETPSEETVEETPVEETPVEEPVVPVVEETPVETQGEHAAFVAEIKNKIAFYEKQLEEAEFNEGIAIRNEIAGLKKLI